MNRYEALSTPAHQESWSWNLACTTCGHGVCRWALKALAHGYDPGSDIWPVHWGGEWTFETLTRANGSLPSRTDFSVAEQRAIHEAVVGCDLSQLCRSVSFPDWLGHLGVLLAYT